MDIGDKITLYGIVHVDNAWKDLWDRWHSGTMLMEVKEITIVDIRTDVPGMWGSGKFTGYKAEDAEGHVFEKGWDAFPDDSAFGAAWRTQDETLQQIDEKWIDWEEAWRTRYALYLVDQNHNPIFPWKDEKGNETD
jgi:hypothetical protein